MISKAKTKLIHSLAAKKNREAEGLFAAEGPKVVGDLMALSQPRLIAATAEWLTSNVVEAGTGTDVFEVSPEELRKISFLQHPQQVLALFDLPDRQDIGISADELTIALDGVQDPGNLGTIIRMADWFGVKQVVCSRDTADAYNPKTVQATMGSIARVRVTYTDLNTFITTLPDTTPVYGTMLDGTDIYKRPLSKGGVIVMGNEGKGISPEVADHLTDRLLIPAYPGDRATAESLNVAIATAITLAEFRRRAGE